MEQIVLLIVSVFSFAAGGLMQYRCLKAMGVDCPPRDNCSANLGAPFFGRSCECDNQCHFFDDCCLDAPPEVNENKSQDTPRTTCLKLDPLHSVYAVGECSSSWNGSSAVQRKCEHEDDFGDLLMSLPTTDTNTNLTYANRYCSECNYANPEDQTSWIVALTCNSLKIFDLLYNNITRDFIVGNLTRLGRSWGVYHWSTGLNDMKFYPCEVEFDLPQYLMPHVRYCRPNVISTCAINWHCDVVRRYCSEYMAVIYFGIQAYRNAHCALCNHVSIKNPTCYVTEVRGNPSMSFTILLDVNQNDGDTVGETNPCSSGEKYDPFFKKCRALVCAVPGTILRDGRCVPQ